MFMGFSHSSGRADSYADAQRLLDKAMLTPTGRTRKEGTWGYPLGTKKPGSRHIRRSGNDIIMRLYNTDVVTWHSETSFSIDSWSSKTTGEFASALTPVSVGADSTITYRTVERTDPNDWRTYRDGMRVCKGDVTFNLVDGFWLPDEATCTEFCSVELDRKGARAVSKAHHLAEFEMWLSMAPRHMRVEHQSVDNGIVAEALLARDWKTAAQHLPLIEQPRGFSIELKPIPIVTHSYNRFVTMSSVKRFRDWLYDAEGLFSRTVHKTLSCDEYANARKRVGALARAGVYANTGWRW